MFNNHQLECAFRAFAEYSPGDQMDKVERMNKEGAGKIVRELIEEFQDSPLNPHYQE